MKTFLPKFAGLLMLFLISTTTELFPQSPGTFSFSVTTTSTGGYSPKNLLAIWIENGGTNFVKTKIKYCSDSNLDHLPTWVQKSGQNVIDAITGATRTAHGTVTFLWNGTDVSSTLVPDGDYKVWLEMAWASSGEALNSFTFTKGSVPFHSEPANTTNFLSLILDWAPTTTGVEGTLENKDIKIYPNPSSGLLNIDFRQPHKDCIVQILNEAGKQVFYERIQDIQAGVKIFNLTGMPSGVYFCTVHLSDKDLVFRVILTR